MSDFDTSSKVKARKLHRCCECYGAINPGDTYEKVFVVQDGDASNFKTCQKCTEARDWLLNETDWPHDIDAKGIRISSRCCVTTSVSKAGKATANTHFERIGLSS